MALGRSQQLEGEEGQEEGNPPRVHSLGDRTFLDMPRIQSELLHAVHEISTLSWSYLMAVGG